MKTLTYLKTQHDGSQLSIEHSMDTLIGTIIVALQDGNDSVQIHETVHPNRNESSEDLVVRGALTRYGQALLRDAIVAKLDLPEDYADIALRAIHIELFRCCY
jgi:hypothetical protein